MSWGSCANAMAVLTRTASAPISIASAASDGEPIPASTTTGMPACSTMIRICSSVCSPCADPIGDPSGMTVTVPISSSFRASTGSALMYGSTLKPSVTSERAAFSVSSGSGNR